VASGSGCARWRSGSWVGSSRLPAHRRVDRPRPSQTALRLLALDPLQEPVHRALMQLYVEAGRRGAALRQYQLRVAALREELRAKPETETTALYDEILRQRPPGHSPSGGDDLPAPGGMRGEDTVIQDQVDCGAGDEGREFLPKNSMGSKRR
jgi:hypothetical protein